MSEVSDRWAAIDARVARDAWINVPRAIRDKHAANVAAAAPLAAAVLALHAPASWGEETHCRGCPTLGWQPADIPWPCQTYALVMEWRER